MNNGLTSFLDPRRGRLVALCRTHNDVWRGHNSHDNASEDVAVSVVSHT